MATSVNLLSAAVAQSGEVLVEAHSGEQHKEAIADTVRKIVSRLPPRVSARKTVDSDTCQYHYKSTDSGYIFICAAERGTPTRVAFRLLADLEETFQATGHSVRKTKHILVDKLRFYNSGENDNVLKVQNQIDEVKGVMNENISHVIDRGEKLEVLDEKSKLLQDQAGTFQKRSTSLKRAMWWQNAKLWLLIICIIVVVLFVLLLIICGGFSFKKCK